MITRYKVWMDNIGLQDLDDAICITDIKEKTPKINAVTAAKPLGGGSHLLLLRRDSISITVRFAIRAYDIATRKRIMSAVRAWAHEGYLSINDRPGQRLWVVCDKPPVVESALKWTAEMEMTLTAYDVPYWEADTPYTGTYTGKNGSANLTNPGDIESVLEATITPAAALHSFTIGANGNTFAFSGLSIASGSAVEISHTPQGILRVKSGSTSLLGKRSATSADEIIIKPGTNAVSFTADASCTAIFSTRGRYD